MLLEILFLTGLLEMIRPKGLDLIHAAALAKERQGSSFPRFYREWQDFPLPGIVDHSEDVAHSLLKTDILLVGLENFGQGRMRERLFPFPDLVFRE